MECVLTNQKHAIKGLLGYDWEDGKLIKKHRPIVDVNALDAKGNNALMLAIQPSLIHSDG